MITEAYAALNRRELSATTPDWVNIDHRRGDSVRARRHHRVHPSRMGRLAWTPSIYIEAVHRLSNLGAVVTHVAHGISQEGFDAEWRDVHLLTVEGDMVNRSELFDEADLDAALARFDQLSRPAPRLENAASQAAERYLAHFASPRLGCAREGTGRRHLYWTIVGGRATQASDMVEMPEIETCGRPSTPGSRT